MDKIDAMDLKTIVTNAITEVFDTMLSMEVEAVDADQQTGIDGNQVSGLIDIKGEIQGRINILVGDTFAGLMAASMLGMEPEEIEGEEEVNDVISEVLNIVGGNLKTALGNSGISCELSTPSISTGTGLGIELKDNQRLEKFAFNHQQHPIIVEISIDKEEILQPPEAKEDVADKETFEGKDQFKVLDDTADKPSETEIRDQETEVGGQDDTADKPSEAEIRDQGSKAGVQDLDDTAGKPSETDEQAEPADVASVEISEAGKQAEEEVTGSVDAPADKTTEAGDAPAAVDKEHVKAIEGLANKDITKSNLDLILGIPLEIIVELGQTSMKINELLTLGPGSAITLDNLEGETLNILANKKLIARGVVVVDNEKYGIRITEIVSRKKRLESLKKDRIK